MEKKEVTIGAPVRIAGITLIPVTEMSMKSWQWKRDMVVSGTKQPLSLVILSPEHRQAFRISGEEVSLDELIREFPGIKDRMEEIP
jgi:hypothetical protein